MLLNHADAHISSLGYLWRNSRAFDRHVFVSSQDRWSMDFDVMRMISAQIRWQDPCWSLCKLCEQRLDFI